MTNFEMICKNPDYSHVVKKAIINECAVVDNHLHLCLDVNCAECQGKRDKGCTCEQYVEKWLDEEFRPVFEKKETTSTKDMLVSEIDDDGDLILVKRR